MTRHLGPPTFESRVRGLLLGLALGDAVGSRQPNLPPTGPLAAGAATQLAAWTVEGHLRAATRYGGYVIGNPVDVTLYAYQRWALLRGATAAPGAPWFPVIEDLDRLPTRGWLIDVHAMSGLRGSSPTTLAAVTTGRPGRSAGCQAMLRGIPIAAFVGHAGSHQIPVDRLAHHARGVAGISHDHPAARASAGLAVTLAAGMLQANGSVVEVVRNALAGHDDVVMARVAEAERLGVTQPCVPRVLKWLAPDRSGISALAGALYVVQSFPEPDKVAEAVEFSGSAPHGDYVAAAAGAFLGALHGFEALPPRLVERLELGWVMDRLARDLALQISRNQAGAGWKGESDEEPLDPWWDTKYPGV